MPPDDPKQHRQHPAGRFAVTHQTFDEHYTPEGTRQVMARVHFETPSGVKAHVEVPDTHYTAENVHNLIVPRVEEIEKTQALDGTPPAPPRPLD